MVDEKTSTQAMDDARKALFKAALKAAQYLDDTFTPADTQGGQDALSRESGKDYYHFDEKRADVALRLLEIAFFPKK